MHADTDPEAGGHAAQKQKQTHEDFQFLLGLGDLPKASRVRPRQSVTQNREQKSEDSKNRCNGYTDEPVNQRNGYPDRSGAVPKI